MNGIGAAVVMASATGWGHRDGHKPDCTGFASQCEEEFGFYSKCDRSHLWFLRSKVTSSD